jgi:hypothetical protein
MNEVNISVGFVEAACVLYCAHLYYIDYSADVQWSL